MYICDLFSMNIMASSYFFIGHQSLVFTEPAGSKLVVYMCKIAYYNFNMRTGLGFVESTKCASI